MLRKVSTGGSLLPVGHVGALRSDSLGSPAQPLPLTVNLVRRMAASLGEGGYRAVEQYFSRARQEHLRSLGEAPSDVVEDAIKMYTRACQRGIGPSEFKDCFRFERLAGIRALRAPPSREDIGNVHDDECLWPTAMVVMGTWWMARGIEISFALTCHVRLDHPRRQVGWLLAASKRDPQALGEESVRRCSCDGDESLTDICPYQVTAYFKLLRDRFGDTLSSADARVPLQTGRGPRSARQQSSRPSAQSLCRQEGLLSVPTASAKSVTGSMSTSSTSRGRSSWRALGSSCCSSSSSPGGAVRPSCDTFSMHL